MREAKVRMLKMEPIRVRCRSCNKEIKACAGKTVTCGCVNMTSIKKDVIYLCNLDFFNLYQGKHVT